MRNLMNASGSDTVRVMVCAVAALIIAVYPANAADSVPGATDFFEQRIRPVLVQHCYECHSVGAKAPKGGLRLDDRDAVRRGGASGPVIVPGRPEQSLLLRALMHGDDGPRMPPGGKLPDGVVADFARWISDGAPDPRVAALSPVSAENSGRSHWAFQPIRQPVPPDVADDTWSRSPVDRFILAALHANGMTPSPPADKRTLIRRAYFDLIGIPPRMDEVEAFIADEAPDAFARVVDRLLSSPRYGERWGRHWLDVARYADTKDGVLMYGEDRVRPFAYTYRDYVIRAFNEDVPFDQFIHDQLAADLIEPKVEPWRLAAMGFLTLGRQFDNNIHDVIDDQIDTVSRGLFGLTVSCARCHNHKYDPIPTTDYYSLYGVFANCVQPLVLPRTDAGLLSPEATDFELKHAAREQGIEKFIDQQYNLLLNTARQRVGDYLVHVATTEPDPMETAIYFLSLGPEDLRLPIVARWRQFLKKRVKPDDPVFGPWHDLFALADTGFSALSTGVIGRFEKRELGTRQGQVNPLVLDALSEATLTCKADVAKTYGDLLKRVFEERSPAWFTFADEARFQLLEIVAGRESPTYFPKRATRNYMSRRETDALGSLYQALDRAAVQCVHASPRAMVLADTPDPHETQVYVRGNPARPGERVPRRFLAIVDGEDRKPFGHGSGRLDLARAITATSNPLTSRVMVNRIWMHHFGEPLVETPNDFGVRTRPPLHPELLDYLASVFQRDGWSIKQIHRLIMLSAVYQQSSDDRPDCRERDPENRLWWRMNRRRLDFESMRDTYLEVAGQLDQRIGGRPTDVVGNAGNGRRTVYGLVDRQSVPGVYRAFDFASPDQSAERRPQTTTPQQALFALNSPFMIECAKNLAARWEMIEGSDSARRLTFYYRFLFARLPNAHEMRTGLDFVASVEHSTGTAEKSQLDAWQQLAQVLLLTNEMMFID
jgi:hypothetical protein